MFLLEGQYVYEQMFVCLCEFVILGRCVRVFLEVCVFGGRGGVAMGCYLFVSYPRCLLPSPYQCLCGSTYCTTFLWISFFMCNSHQPHHANKGKCVWTKNFLSFRGFPIIFLSLWWMSLHQALLYHFQSAPWNDYDLRSLWLLSRRHPWSFLKGRFKSSENNACCKRGFPINSSSLPPCAYISKCWMKADWRGRNDTSPSSAHLSLSEVSPLIKKLSLIQSNFPLWYSYHLGENTVVFVCVHNLTPHHESAS